MTDSTDLQVLVFDDEIVVELTGSSYSVTYLKPTTSPGLLAKSIFHKDDLNAPMRVSEFLAQAWKLANDKARELKWIV